MTAAAPQLTLRVEAITPAAEGCNLYHFVAADGAALPAAEAGAHLGLYLPNGMERQYSLIEADPAPASYGVGIKRDPNSRGGSSWIFDTLKLGDTIVADAPRNNFPLDEGHHPTVLIAGGIGITPIRCMARRLQALGRDWVLTLAGRTRAEAAFLDELGGLPNVRLHFDDEAGGVLPIAEIVAAAPSDAHLYCCGPGPMLAAFEAACNAAGIAPERVHVEYFTQKYEQATEGGFVVSLRRSGHEVRVAPGQTILEAIRPLGLDLSTSCEEGICGACETRVLEGVPDHRDAILTEKERAAGKTMFICCSGAKTDRLVLDL